MFFTLWRGDGRWLGNKGTITGVIGGAVKTCFDYYWVFTKIPLVDEDDSDAAKIFYFLGQLIITTAVYGGFGLALDYLRSIYHLQNEKDENTPLTSIKIK